LAVWAHNPIVVKEFDWCPAKVARFAFFSNVKSHILIIPAGCGRALGTGVFSCAPGKRGDKSAVEYLRNIVSLLGATLVVRELLSGIDGDQHTHRPQRVLKRIHRAPIYARTPPH
jgi:hypothetical protein